MRRPIVGSHTVGRGRRRAMVLSLGVAMAAAGVAGHASAAPTDYTFAVILGSPCLEGTAAFDGGINLSLKDDEGVLKDSSTATASGGQWSACFGAPDVSIDIGDRIRASAGVDSRTFTVARLTAGANRNTRVVSGKGPNNSHVSVTLSRYIDLHSCPTKLGTVNRPTDSAGSYAADLSHVGTGRGRDCVRVTWTSPSGDTVGIQRDFPYVSVMINSARFSGHADPDQLVTVTVTTSGGTLRGSGRGLGDEGGLFHGVLQAASNHPAPVRPGNRVRTSFASGVGFTVPSVTINGHADTDTVTGTCAPNRPFEVALPHRQWTTWAGTSDSSGNYTAPFGHPPFNLDLVSGELIETHCLLASADDVGIVGVIP